MLTSPPQQCARYLIARSPSAGEFRELFDCPTYVYVGTSSYTQGQELVRSRTYTHTQGDISIRGDRNPYTQGQELVPSPPPHIAGEGC
jgi:hypothetical protein